MSTLKALLGFAFFLFFLAFIFAAALSFLNYTLHWNLVDGFGGIGFSLMAFVFGTVALELLES